MIDVPKNEKELKIRRFQRLTETKIASNEEEISEEKNAIFIGSVFVAMLTAATGALTYVNVSNYGPQIWETLSTLPVEEIASHIPIPQLALTAGVPIVGLWTGFEFISFVKKCLTRIAQLSDANIHLQDKLTSEGRHI